MNPELLELMDSVMGQKSPDSTETEGDLLTLMDSVAVPQDAEPDSELLGAMDAEGRGYNPLRSLVSGTQRIASEAIGVGATGLAGLGNIAAAVGAQRVADGLVPENVKSDIGLRGQAVVEAEKEEPKDFVGMPSPAQAGAEFAAEAFADVKAMFKGLKKDPKAVLAHLSESGAESAPSMAVMLAAGESRAVGWAIGSFLEFSNELAEAKDTGNLDAGDLLTMALASSVVGKLDQISAGKIVKGVKGLEAIAPKGFLPAVVEAFKSGGEEFSTEYAQTIVSNVAAKIGWDVDRKLLDGALESGIVGFGLGGGASIAGSAVKRIGGKDEETADTGSDLSQPADTAPDLGESAEEAGPPEGAQAEGDAVVPDASLDDAGGGVDPFPDSKVVVPEYLDDAGKPMVVYHGTPGQHKILKGGLGVRTGLNSEGIWFTKGEEHAAEYAAGGPNLDDAPEGARVVSAYVDIQNPYSANMAEAADLNIADLKEQGYDGVFFPETEYWVAFDQSQIRQIGERSVKEITQQAPEAEADAAGGEALDEGEGAAPVPPVEPDRAEDAPTRDAGRDLSDAELAEQDYQGLSHEQSAKLREDLEMSARDPTVTRKMEQDLREAGQSGLVDKIDAVADEVLKSPRALRPVEHAALLLRTTQTLNALEDLRSLANRMIDSGQDVSAVQTQIQASEALIDKYTHAADVSGTEAGRTLNIRKLLINRETLEIAALERKARADKGSELTAEDRVRVKETLDRLVAVKAELEAAEKANAEKDVEIARLRAEAALKGKKVRPTKKGQIEFRNQQRQDLETKYLRELRALGLKTKASPEQQEIFDETEAEFYERQASEGTIPEDILAAYHATMGERVERSPVQESLDDYFKSERASLADFERYAGYGYGDMNAKMKRRFSKTGQSFDAIIEHLGQEGHEGVEVDEIVSYLESFGKETQDNSLNERLRQRYHEVTGKWPAKKPVFPKSDPSDYGDVPFSLSDDVRVGAFPEDVVAFIKARGENPASVRGLVLGGKIYVNEAYADQIEDILAHELVHVGIRGVFGNKVNTVLDRVAASTDPRLVEMADKARRTYQKQTREMPEADANRLIAEEVVAQAAKADYQPGVIRDVFKRMRLLLKKLLGREYNLTDVQAMAALSQGYALRERRFIQGGKFSLAPPTDSAAFRRWFGDSVTANKEGPVRLFHATSNDFSVFDESKIAEGLTPKERAFWFTTEPVVADEYLPSAWVAGKKIDPNSKEAALKWYAPGSNIMSVYLKVESPDIWEMGGGSYDAEFFQQAIKDARKGGADGVIFKNVRDPGMGSLGRPKVSHVVAVFKPTQIKSATGNSGAFDPSNPDIRFDLADKFEEARDLIKQLANLKVEEGADLEGAVAYVQSVLPEVSRVEVYNAISGHKQKGSPRERSEVEKRKASVKRQAKLHSQIADAMQGIFEPKRTRPLADPEIVRLRKLLDKLEAEFFFAEREQARLDAFQDKINKVRDQIDAGLLEVQQREKRVDSPAIEAAKAELKKVKTKQQLLAAIKRAEAGIVKQKGKKGRVDPEIEQLRYELQLLTKELARPQREADRIIENERKASKLRDKVEKATEARKGLDEAVDEGERLRFKNILDEMTRIDKRSRRDPGVIEKAQQKELRELRSELRLQATLADLNEQLRTGNYRGPKQQAEAPEHLQMLRGQVSLARRELREAMRVASKTKFEGALAEAAGISRALVATADLSATLRQAAMLSARMPLVTLKVLAKSMKALGSPEYAHVLDANIRADEHKMFLYNRAKLYISPLGGALSKREESFQSNWAESIPYWGAVVRASERHMITHLNLLRVAAFDQFMETYPASTPEQQRKWAHFINAASGRGSLGSFEQASKDLALVFFAPRFAISRVETPWLFAKETGKLVAGSADADPVIVREMAKNIGAFTGLVGTALWFASMAFGDDDEDFAVGLNPFDSDFGKMIIGGVHIDPWAGFQQPLRLVTGLAQTKTGKDWIGDFGGPTVNPMGAFGRYLSYKTSPNIGAASALFTGKNVIGQDVTLPEVAASSVVPILLQSAYEAWEGGGSLGEMMIVVGAETPGLSASYRDDATAAADIKAVHFKVGGYKPQLSSKQTDGLTIGQKRNMKRSFEAEYVRLVREYLDEGKTPTKARLQRYADRARRKATTEPPDRFYWPLVTEAKRAFED